MNRFELIKSMSIEEMAEIIISSMVTDEYCKNDCDECKKIGIDAGCCLPENEKQCCIKWLEEEIGC